MFIGEVLWIPDVFGSPTRRDHLSRMKAPKGFRSLLIVMDSAV
jgi:hypothetical protein